MPVIIAIRRSKFGQPVLWDVGLGVMVPLRRDGTGFMSRSLAPGSSVSFAVPPSLVDEAPIAIVQEAVHPLRDVLKMVPGE